MTNRPAARETPAGDGPGDRPAAGDDALFAAARRLAGGEVVAVETGAGGVRAVSCRSAAGAAALDQDIGGGDPFLLLRSPAEAADYAPALSDAAVRTLRRWWPGAVEVVVEAGGPSGGGLTEALPPAARGAVVGGGRVRLRCPAGDDLADLGRLTPAPLLAADDSDRPPAGGGVTVAALAADGRFEVVREGAVSAADLSRPPGRTVVFVCTGNTCRSPLAEALFRKLAEDAAPGGADALAAAGVRILSAGLAAGRGGPASPESVALAEDAGADLSRHRSRPLTPELLDEADRVFTMTAAHRAAILRHRPDAADRVTLLDPDGADIPDPLGGGFDEYEACRDAIGRGLDALLPDLLADLPGPPDSPDPPGPSAPPSAPP